MAMIDLKHAYKVTARGKVYWYAWRGKGAPRLTGAPGSPEFLEGYRTAHEGRKGGDKARLSGLCAMFRQSDAWNNRGPKPISPKTRASWTTWLDRIQTEFGELRIEQFDRAAIVPRIVKWRDRYATTPRAADMGIQVFSRLLAFGRAEGKLLNNVCHGIAGIYRNDRADLIWTPEDLETFANTAPAELVQAARLAALTGLRQGDLLKLSWWHIQENSIEIPTGKSGQRKVAIVPVYGELRTYLDSMKKRATTVLVNTDGEPWKSGFGSSWGRAVRKAGLSHLHFHDLRGTAATRFWLGGLKVRSIAQIMAWSEEDVEALLNRYVRKNDILRDMIRQLDENTAATEGEKPSAKPPARKPSK